MRIWLAGLVLLTGSSLPAEESGFCQSVSGIEEIKSYLVCQSSPELAACAGLATAAGSRLLARKGLELRRGILERRRERFQAELARAYHEQSKAKALLATAQERDRYSSRLLADLEAYIASEDDYNKGKGAGAVKLADLSFEDLYRNKERLSKGLRFRVLRLHAWREILRRANGRLPVFTVGYDQAEYFRTGVAVDRSNLAYDDLPRSERIKFEAKAKVAADAISDQLKRGLPVDQTFLDDLALNFSRVTAEQELVLSEETARAARGSSSSTALTADQTVEDKLRRHRLAVEEVDRIFKGFAPDSGTAAGRMKEIQASRPFVDKAAELYARAKPEGGAWEKALGKIMKAGAKSPLLLGGVVGAGVLAAQVVAGEVMSSQPTACAQPNQALMNVQAGHSCTPVHRVDGRVLKFLSLAPEEQQEWLKNPELCEYYKTLHKSFLTVPRFKKLECQTRGFQLVTESEDGGTVEHKVSYHAGSKDVRQINLTSLTPPATKMVSPLMADDKGRLTGLESERVARTAIALKLYLADAHECCRSASDSEAHRCLAEFNSDPRQDDGSARPVKGTP